MRIVDLSDKNLRTEFAKTRLPNSSYEKYKKYVTDLDIYYYGKDYDSPRMPEHIFSRASIMTQRYIISIDAGMSKRLAESISRDYVYSPDRHFAQDYLAFLAKYCRDHNLTEYEEILFELNRHCFEKGKTHIDEEALGSSRNLAMYIAEDPFFNTKKFLDILSFANPEEYEKIIYPPRILSKVLIRALESCEKLIYNKHIRRHLIMSANPVYIKNRVVRTLRKVYRVVDKCQELINEDRELCLQVVFVNDVHYLTCMIETIKDIYLLY